MKLPSGCALALGHQRECAGCRDDQDESEPLHAAHRFAVGRPEQREVRVERERAPEPRLRDRVVPEAALDVAAVEELERVLRAEAERARASGGAPRRSGRCGRAPTPSTSSPSIDGRSARATRARASAWRQSDAVVDLEEGDLEVGLDAVRVQQPLDRADQRVLAVGEHGPAGDPVQVAERRDVLRQRDRVDRLPLGGDRLAVGAASGERLRERVEAVGVVGEDPEREAELALGVGDPAVAEVELAELDVRPGGRLRGAGWRRRPRASSP